MKVFVTGGAGFIGSNTSLELSRLGNNVLVLDDLSLGRTENLKADGKFVPGIKFKRGSITNQALVNQMTKGSSAIIHFGSASSAPMYEPDPRKATFVTFNGFLNVLEAARKFDVEKVVYASSSSVYGNNKPPHSEDREIRPISFYISTKMAMEYFAEVYMKMYGMKCVGLRYFSVYGPRENHKGKYANVISQFLWLMRKGQSPVLYGDGNQSRDYIYIKDVVAANILAMRKNVSGIFNVGTGKAYSFNDVINVLNKLLKTSIKPKYMSNPIKNYIRHTLADTKKAEKELGFRAKFSLEDGIKDIIKSGF